MKINGKSVPLEPGWTLLDAARAHGFHVPTLCHLDGSRPTGRCGICVVEVEGAGELVPACSTPARDGMAVKTESRAVVEARREVLRKLLASGYHNCVVAQMDLDSWTDFQMEAMKRPWHGEICPAHGACKLQDLAIAYGVEIDRADLPSAEFPLDDSHPMFVRDFSRCIRCGRCAKACNEVQVNLAIPFNEQAAEEGRFPVADYDLCVHCGECVQACPVGAIFEKKAFARSHNGELRKVRTTCPYCGVGCQLQLHVKDQEIVKVTGVEGARPNDGRLCVKGRFGYDFIYSEERLATPLVRENGSFREASWDEALGLVADRFQAIVREHGPDAIGGVSCARSINEDSYQMQKLFRAVIGTHNIDHCART